MSCLNGWTLAEERDGTFMFRLIFADDQVLLTEQDELDLEFMLKCLCKVYNDWGLNINVTKTHYSSTDFK